MKFLMGYMEGIVVPQSTGLKMHGTTRASEKWRLTGINELHQPQPGERGKQFFSSRKNVSQMGRLHKNTNSTVQSEIRRHA